MQLKMLNELTERASSDFCMPISRAIRDQPPTPNRLEKATFIMVSVSASEVAAIM